MDKKIKVAINGFGRIGRTFLRVALKRNDLEVVAVNDLGELKNLEYLLKYDSVYRRADFNVASKTNDKPTLVAGDQEILFLSDRDPSNLPWKDLDIDVVVEATGAFASFEKSKVHLSAGAKRVVITAPVKDEPTGDITGATVLMGINEDRLSSCQISSNASCTTNSASPLVYILNKAIGIEKALLNTVHGYTSTQELVDTPCSKDYRRGRAAGQNIVPSSTGAAIAVTKVITELTDKFDGIAMRVPVISGSIADITFVASRKTSVQEVNSILRDSAKEEQWEKIFSVTEEPIVSSDVIGSEYASIADLSMTRVVDGDLVKVLAWYDNEMGYVHALLEHVIASGRNVLLRGK